MKREGSIIYGTEKEIDDFIRTQVKEQADGEYISKKEVHECIKKRWSKSVGKESAILEILDEDIAKLPSVAIPSSEPTSEQVNEYCAKRCLTLVSNEFMTHIIADSGKAIRSKPSAYKGMTNGEVIKSLYPNATYYEETHGYGYVYSDVVRCEENYMMTFDKEWWNSPYKPQERSDKE